MRAFVGACLILTGTICAEELPPASERPVVFSRDIEPLFKKRCLRCHGPKRQRSEFRLDRRQAALKGGLSGLSIIAGDSVGSALISHVAGVKPFAVMPPEGKRLSAGEIGLLRAWIDQGASFGDQEDSVDDEPPSPSHWAFRSIFRPPPPSVNRAVWTRNPIDAFILARLESAGLKPSPPADRRTLIRRSSLILLGLPPTPKEVEAFVADPEPNAYEKLVDRFLASPRYGERWARHWLDVIRFAETYGFEPNKPRDNAWPFRDYVIEVFNDDRPYDEFFRDQLAGDAFGEPRGTGYLVAGPQDQVESPNLELTLNKRANELHDIVSTTGSAFLGLTVGCARCHNHKFDPVSQRDYYALTAVFAGINHGERHLPLSPAAEEERLREIAACRKQLNRIIGELAQASPLPRLETTTSGLGAQSPRVPVNARFTLDRFAPVTACAVRLTVLETNGMEPCVDELEVFSTGDDSHNVAAAAAGGVPSASGTLIGHRRHKQRYINDGWHGNGRSWVSKEIRNVWVQIDWPELTQVDTVVWARGRLRQRSDRVTTAYRIELKTESGEWLVVANSADREPWTKDKESKLVSSGLSDAETATLTRLHTERQELEKRLATLQKGRPAYLGQFTAPPTTHLLHRGDPLQKREPVTPGAIERVGTQLQMAEETSEQERRIALARWINDTANPLTARVFVNRLWLYHFGAGIVNTPSDFGVNGERPSHPELLDWLASELNSSGGSIKHLQRLILLSQTYRQSSRPDEAARAVDAQNRLLWRFPPQRLAAEPIRDSILWLSGSLQTQMGGPGYHVFEANNNYVRVYKPKQEYSIAEWRRMVYQYKPRMEQDAIFGVFDCPDAAQVVPKRARSTTPLQALNLLNSGFMMQQAERCAERLLQDVARENNDNKMSAAVRHAFQLAFARAPNRDELAAAVRVAKEHGLHAVCRALFNTNEFLHVQ